MLSRGAAAEIPSRDQQAARDCSLPKRFSERLEQVPGLITRIKDCQIATRENHIGINVITQQGGLAVKSHPRLPVPDLVEALARLA
jgi:hypothetical protein